MEPHLQELPPWQCLRGNRESRLHCTVMVDREAEGSKEREERKTRNWHKAYPEGPTAKTQDGELRAPTSPSLWMT